MDMAFNSFGSKIDPQDTKHKIQLQLSQSETYKRMKPQLPFNSPGSNMRQKKSQVNL